jgi:acyl-CoA synthetase (AMP-forming)/AMP-acid ligase II
MHLTGIADRTPDKPAVVMADGSRTVTYAELDRRSRQVAQLLRARGLGVRDHVAHCRTSLAGFKCPRAVEFVTELPRLPTGKLLRSTKARGPVRERSRPLPGKRRTC